ncbi:MAG: MarR family transcriptional regulator [Dehalococcoidales bacterium]|nr:MarR family transcriptional regulator [Dehalococcoidales bacterium]
MDKGILEKVTEDLLSIPPRVFRIVRNKLVRTTLTDIGAEITPHQFEIIRLLMEEGTMHVAEIGHRLEIAKAQMTKLIDRLEETGIIERVPDESDRRVTNIALTHSGIQLLEEHRRIIENAASETMSVLTDEELKDLYNSLRTLRDILVKLEWG